MAFIADSGTGKVWFEKEIGQFGGRIRGEDCWTAKWFDCTQKRIRITAKLLQTNGKREK